jgi:kynurenine formamidase
MKPKSNVTRLRTHYTPTSTDTPDLYDWSTERPHLITINHNVARYMLVALRQITTPAHPQAHADAITHLTKQLGAHQ